MTTTETKESKQLIVFLDPAHGSDTPGKRSPDGTHREYQWSRYIINKLKPSLESKGIKVVITNPTEDEIGLRKRAQVVTNYKIQPGQVKFLLSLHNNAAGDGSRWMNATGFSAYTTKGKTLSDYFAEVIMDYLIRDFPGLKARVDMSDGDKDWEENFTVLTGQGYYAVLLEWLFQDNAEDVLYLRDETYNNKLVASLTEALEHIQFAL